MFILLRKYLKKIRFYKLCSRKFINSYKKDIFFYYLRAAIKCRNLTFAQWIDSTTELYFEIITDLMGIREAIKWRRIFLYIANKYFL